jgi:hypothetical protein
VSKMTIHNYAASDGWTLCNVCGKPEKDELHGYVKPGPEKLSNGNFICPGCNGRKETFVMACGPKGGWQGYRPCYRCGGTGEVTEGDLKRIEVARKLRQDRIERRLVLREEAARLGVSFPEWSRIENGKETETEEGRRALEIRLKEIGVQS